MTSGAPDRDVRPRTRAGRLAGWDRFLLATERALLTAAGPAALFDVGFGHTPVTTREWAASAWSVNPGLSLVGVERDAGRVASAQAMGGEGRLRFAEAGFAGLAALGPARVVRAANVLRAYPGEAVAGAWAALAAPLIEGGVVLEGSSDAGGAVSAFVVLRRVGAQVLPEALVFHCEGARAFAPRMLRDVLPRAWRRGVGPTHPVLALLAQWHAVHVGGDDPVAAFARSGALLAQAVPGVTLPLPGLLRWAPEVGALAAPVT